MYVALIRKFTRSSFGGLTGRLWRPESSREILTWKSNVTIYCACPRDSWPTIHVIISKFAPEMHLSAVKVPIDFGLDWQWASISFSGNRLRNYVILTFSGQYRSPPILARTTKLAANLFWCILEHCVDRPWPSMLFQSKWHRDRLLWGDQENNSSLILTCLNPPNLHQKQRCTFMPPRSLFNMVWIDT